MSTTPPKESPWRRGLPPTPIGPQREIAERHRAQRSIMNDTERRDQAGRRHENALAGRVGNGGRHT